MSHSLMEGARNFRDLGGYVTTDGRRVRSGLVFRSDRLAGLTDTDIERIREIGIRTVVDFRPEKEQELTGHNRLPDGVTTVNIPVLDMPLAESMYKALGDGDFSAMPDLIDHNRALLRDFSAEFGEALRLLADEDNLPLVFHCIGGKDRTGMTAALLLALLHVPIDEVRRDYIRSNDALGEDPASQEAFLNKVIKRQGVAGELTPAAREGLRRFFVLEEAYFDAAWDEIHSMAGSLEEYATVHLGLTEDHIAQLRRLLLDV